MKDEDWKPPFYSIDARPDMVCPACGKGGCVRVREKETYFDADVAEAYCSACHARLEVQTSVEITFSDPEVIEYGL